METTCYSVGGIFDDSRSVSSLTTVPVSNRSKVTPETCRVAEVPHQDDEKDVDTIDSDPSQAVAGSHHRSIFSDLSDDSETFDADLRAEMEHAQKVLKETKEKAKKEQRKRNRDRAKQAEHEGQKKRTKKPRDDEDDENGNEGGGKPTAAAGAAAPPAVSAK